MGLSWIEKGKFFPDLLMIGLKENGGSKIKPDLLDKIKNM